MLSSKIYASSALAFLLASQCAVAKSENAYGPVASGQTLWDIAAEVRPDSSVSVVQLVYSLYDLNPNAFQSSNMNLLKKGVYLKMPTKDKVLKMSNRQAASVFKEHTLALRALSASAGTLNKAKKKRSKYAKQVKRLQKTLGTFRYKSNAWNKTYKQLADSKSLYKKWNNKVAGIRKDLVAKTLAPSVATPAAVPVAEATSTPVASSKSSANVTAMEERMKALEGKVGNFASMEKRFAILEAELGQKEKIILKLRSTLRVAATAMKKQQAENIALQQKLQALDPSSKLIDNKPKLELQVAGTEKVAASSAPTVSAKLDSTKADSTADKDTKTKVTEVIAKPKVEVQADNSKVAVASAFATAKKPIVSPAKATAKPEAIKATTTISPKKVVAKKTKADVKLSRDEKRRLRMAKANQGNTDFTSIVYWKTLLTQNLILVSAVLGGLLLLVLSSFVINGRRKKKKKAQELEDKHRDLFIDASKLSDVNTSDDNISPIDLKKAS